MEGGGDADRGRVLLRGGAGGGGGQVGLLAGEPIGGLLSGGQDGDLGGRVYGRRAASRTFRLHPPQRRTADGDGHPELVRGCGWYVDDPGESSAATATCSRARRSAKATPSPLVRSSAAFARPVTSGPHLRYEVHATTAGSDDHNAASAVDPVWWQAANYFTSRPTPQN
jgi:hypothetical protein